MALDSPKNESLDSNLEFLVSVETLLGLAYHTLFKCCEEPY
jgi:hypothetical protein